MRYSDVTDVINGLLNGFVIENNVRKMALLLQTARL